jgi:hypothetical protein
MAKVITLTGIDTVRLLINSNVAYVKRNNRKGIDNRQIISNLSACSEVGSDRQIRVSEY